MGNRLAMSLTAAEILLEQLTYLKEKCWYYFWVCQITAKKGKAFMRLVHKPGIMLMLTRPALSSSRVHPVSTTPVGNLDVSFI